MLTPTTYNAAKERRDRMYPNKELSPEFNARMMMKLMEESGELAGAMASFFGRKYRPELQQGDLKAIKGEVGDILILLIGICDLWQIDMDECLRLTNSKLDERHAQLTANGSN